MTAVRTPRTPRTIAGALRAIRNCDGVDTLNALAGRLRAIAWNDGGAIRAALEEQRGALARKVAPGALGSAQMRRIIDRQIEPGDVAALRHFVQLSQSEFARALGISVRTLQNWEQGRVAPEGTGLALLAITARHPEIIREQASNRTGERRGGE